MSQQTSEFESAFRRLERQADELIDKDTNLLTAVSRLEFGKTPVVEAADEWDAKYSYQPMVRAFYCKELAGFTTVELYDYLADAERASTLGLNPDQFAPDKVTPGRTTLGRAWRDRFSDHLKRFITQSAERILAIAHNMGNPLGMRALKPTDRTDCSNRSKRRYISEKAKDVTDALCQITFPAIDLGRPDEGTQYP